jgi:outer membrane protein, multidrug efflux system
MTRRQTQAIINRQPMRFIKLLTGIILLSVLSACSPFTAQIEPEKMLSVPEQYINNDNGAVNSSVDQWWHDFASNDLNRLIDEALTGNLSLRQTWARMEQARALTSKSESSQLPSLDFNAERSDSRSHNNGSTNSSDNTTLGLSSSFEVDLWGRISAEINSQQKEHEATREELNAAAITLSAEVADSWLQLLKQIEQQQLLSEQIETAQSYLNLIDLRFRKSQATALDLLQQKESIAALETQIPALQAEEQRLRYKLSVFMGNNPQQQLELTNVNLPQLQPLPALGIPSQLLDQRPDIRAASLRLQSAGWDLSVSQADRLPALKLTATATTSGGFSDLFDNWLLNLANNLTAPLIDGGSRSAEVDRQKAIVDEKLAAYQEVVLTAIREVEDSLITEQKLQEQQAAQRHQLNLAEQALSTARNHYLKGLSTYLPVLTELQNVEQLQQDLLSQQLSLLTNRVVLHRSLGGNWTEHLPAQKSEVQI